MREIRNEESPILCEVGRTEQRDREERHSKYSFLHSFYYGSMIMFCIFKE